MYQYLTTDKFIIISTKIRAVQNIEVEIRSFLFFFINYVLFLFKDKGFVVVFFIKHVIFINE